MLFIYYLAVVACLVPLQVGAAITSSVTQQKPDIIAVALLSTDEVEATHELAKTRDLVLPTMTPHEKLARRAPAAKAANITAPLNPPAQFQVTRRSPSVSRISVTIEVGDDSTTPDDEEDASTDPSDMDESISETTVPLIKRDLPPALAAFINYAMNANKTTAPLTKRDLPPALIAFINHAMNANKTAASPTKRDLPPALVALLNANKTASITRRHLVL